jgi:hypothetical protein
MAIDGCSSPPANKNDWAILGKEDLGFLKTLHFLLMFCLEIITWVGLSEFFHLSIDAKNHSLKISSHFCSILLQ